MIYFQQTQKTLITIPMQPISTTGIMGFKHFTFTLVYLHPTFSRTLAGLSSYSPGFLTGWSVSVVYSILPDSYDRIHGTCIDANFSFLRAYYLEI